MADRRGPTQLLTAKRYLARSVLLDTGAMLAIVNVRDDHHRAASECLKLIAASRLPLFITLPTIYESYRRILFGVGQGKALQFLEEIFDGSVNVVRTIDQDEVDAKRTIEMYLDFGLTLTDAVSMAVMSRLGIATVFSFDSHFLQAGYIRIPPYFPP